MGNSAGGEKLGGVEEFSRGGGINTGRAKQRGVPRKGGYQEVSNSSWGDASRGKLVMEEGISQGRKKGCSGAFLFSFHGHYIPLTVHHFSFLSFHSIIQHSKARIRRIIIQPNRARDTDDRNRVAGCVQRQVGGPQIMEQRPNISNNTF